MPQTHAQINELVSMALVLYFEKKKVNYGSKKDFRS